MTCANKISQWEMFLDIVNFFKICEILPTENVGNYNGFNVPTQERTK